MPRPFASAILVVLAVAVSACSSAQADSSPARSDANPPTMAAEASLAPSADSGTPMAGTDLNACELVTVADIAAAVGVPEADIPAGELRETPTVLSPGHTDCRYLGDWGGVIVSLTPEDGANLYDAARGSYDDASDRPVVGADGAFWSQQNKRGFFWKGNVTVMLQMSFLAGGGDVDEVVTAIGQAAMDRVD